jgi:hypothetical protein
MKLRRLLFFILLTSCAAWDRECAQCGTEVHGANWLVVQLKMDGEIKNCWQLKDLAVANERSSDGIWWVDRNEQVHISGWYNYVQVHDWNTAAVTLGVNLAQCTGGRYHTLEEIKEAK